MRDADFERLVHRYHRAVHAYARSMASTPSIAEDAVQETFVRAWKYLDSFRGDGSFEGWLIRICRRCVLDQEARERTAAMDIAPGGGARHGPSLTQAPDHRGEVLAVLRQLPRKYREVLVVCGILGYDYETAATILDVPIGTVRSRLHRGRLALAVALSPEDESVDGQASA
ncbi:MAG: RNA polymerase sigma factor [Acidimicrobiales bacterium]